MYVFVRNQFEGFHRWKNAPDEVKFLRDSHRHIFKVKTTVQVQFADRDIEFIMLQHEINDIINSWKDLNTLDWSCETMAIAILKVLSSKYPNRHMICEVSEDGENGAIVDLNDLEKLN